ncbi:MAG: hypothetical protein ACRESZ_07325 [Methylococcales bacterium]
MNESTHYIKIVEWSEEDESFIGQCPGIIGPCCHGDDKAEVYAELCKIVDEWIVLMKKERKPPPTPTAGRNVVEKIA